VPHLVSFRVVSSFLALKPSQKRETFVTVPAGSIIETAAEVGESGFVTITLQDQVLFAFMRDLEERSEPLQQAISS
jgi:hypothetical protein